MNGRHGNYRGGGAAGNFTWGEGQGYQSRTGMAMLNTGGNFRPERPVMMPVNRGQPVPHRQQQMGWIGVRPMNVRNTNVGQMDWERRQHEQREMERRRHEQREMERKQQEQREMERRRHEQREMERRQQEQREMERRQHEQREMERKQQEMRQVEMQRRQIGMQRERGGMYRESMHTSTEIGGKGTDFRVNSWGRVGRGGAETRPRMGGHKMSPKPQTVTSIPSHYSENRGYMSEKVKSPTPSRNLVEVKTGCSPSNQQSFVEKRKEESLSRQRYLVEVKTGGICGLSPVADIQNQTDKSKQSALENSLRVNLTLPDQGNKTEKKGCNSVQTVQVNSRGDHSDSGAGDDVTAAGREITCVGTKGSEIQSPAENKLLNIGRASSTGDCQSVLTGPDLAGTRCTSPKREEKLGANSPAEGQGSVRSSPEDIPGTRHGLI